MVMIGDCISCQYGDHEGHTEVTQAVPEGMLGGGRCECKGDCGERNANLHPPIVFDEFDRIIGTPRVV